MASCSQKVCHSRAEEQPTDIRPFGGEARLVIVCKHLHRKLLEWVHMLLSLD